MNRDTYMAHEPRRKSLCQQLADLHGNGQNHSHRQTTASPMATSSSPAVRSVSTVTPLLRRRPRTAPMPSRHRQAAAPRLYSLDVTNPGLWMAHCHIAEHHESGMMFSFNVTP